ncbi:hypothetical protein [Phenylobacterium sp.]|jgi:cell division septation protein DedD|uniref:hypothetical protein n=1 Tax=Phenylobacterium sp. TaxID=1871053 RepID=UPI002F427F96
MATLDIRPHSRRISGLAVAALSVIAVGAFAEGLGHQLRQDEAAAFPAPQGPPLRTDLAAAATPAPLLPDPTPAPVRHAAAAPDETAAAADALGADAGAAAAQPADAQPGDTKSSDAQPTDAPPADSAPPASVPPQAATPDEAPR